MRIPNNRARKFSATVIKILMALLFASMIGGVSIAPASDRDYGRHEAHYDLGRHEHGRYYSASVYAPPTDVYGRDQYQAPGIGFVFGIQFR